MFPTPFAPTTPAPAPARGSRLRRTLDLLIAFATLADGAPAGASAPGPLGAGDALAGPSGHASRTAPPESAGPSAPFAAVPPPATAAARALARARETAAPLSAFRAAAALPASPPPAAARAARTDGRGAQPRHPHRRALHAPARHRRPGAVRAAPQPCLTPLPARHAGRGRTSLAPSR
jgi:hypothetical protein